MQQFIIVFNPHATLVEWSKSDQKFKNKSSNANTKRNNLSLLTIPTPTLVEWS